MSTGVITAVFALSVVVCLVSGVWLVLHLTALTALFHGKADIVASPKRTRAPRSRVVTALAAFGLSLAGILAVQIAATAA